MKIKILPIAFITLISLQAYSQLAYDVLVLDNLIHQKTEKNHLNVSLAMETITSPSILLQKETTVQLQTSEQVNLPQYLSSASLKKHTTKKTISNFHVKNSLNLTFYTTGENTLIKRLNPVDFHFQNSNKTLNIPKGFGPMIKI